MSDKKKEKKEKKEREALKEEVREAPTNGEDDAETPE